MSSSLVFHQARGAFPSTRWSLVAAAAGQHSGNAAAALETLCRSYWYPLYGYVRRSGQSPHDAQDLVQEFFCRLLEKGWLEGANRERGRLRSFLIVALRHFMANEWRRQTSGRRGGARTHVPLDADLAESRYAAAPEAPLAAEKMYDREWALTLLDLTLTRLAAEYAGGRRPQEFAELKDCLMAARGAIDYAAVAGKLEVSEGAARVAVHRLRKRFRAIYREEISQTLAEGVELEDELRYLAAVLAEG